jgi:hypothetical protein
LWDLYFGDAECHRSEAGERLCLKVFRSAKKNRSNKLVTLAFLLSWSSARRLIDWREPE